MRLLDFVEQHHRIGATADGFGQLAPLVVSDVPGRGSDQSGNRVLLHVFRHVNPDHRPLIVEEEFGQGASQLGLAYTGRTKEHEGADWAMRIGQTSPAPAHRVCHCSDSVVLADHPLV